MEEQNTNPEVPQSQTQQPVDSSAKEVNPKAEPVLQPTQNFVDEMKAAGASTPTNNAPRPSPSSIYPEVNNDIPQTNPTNTATAPKKRSPFKTILYVFIIFWLISLGLYFFEVLIKPKVHSVQTAVEGHGYVNHDMSVNGKTLFTISFDRSATKGGAINNPYTDLVGNDLKGNQMAVFIEADTIAPISPSSCYGPDRNTTPPIINYSKIGTTTILGSTDTICGFISTPSSAANESSYIEFQSNGNWYNIQFVMAKLSQSVDINTVSQIAQSIKRL